jgi:hypothetical protein
MLIVDPPRPFVSSSVAPRIATVANEHKNLSRLRRGPSATNSLNFSAIERSRAEGNFDLDTRLVQAWAVQLGAIRSHTGCVNLKKKRA